MFVCLLDRNTTSSQNLGKIWKNTTFVWSKNNLQFVCFSPKIGVLFIWSHHRLYTVNSIYIAPLCINKDVIIGALYVILDKLQ